MDIIVQIFLILFAAGTFLVSLLQLIQQIIKDFVNKK